MAYFKVAGMLATCFFAGFLPDPENVGDLFFRNVG
jgi:hypothetical protein